MRFFYGWWLVGFAWILYGFGAAPGYYSWSFFSPEIIDELDLTRAQTGAVFGLFTFMFNSIAPVTGLAIARWGTRRVMVVGNLFTALGCWLLSGAGSLWECLVYFGILVGAGIGLSTIVPCQALATSWFTKYRARAVAAVLTAGEWLGSWSPGLTGSWCRSTPGERAGKSSPSCPWPARPPISSAVA